MTYHFYHSWKHFRMTFPLQFNEMLIHVFFGVHNTWEKAVLFSPWPSIQMGITFLTLWLCADLQFLQTSEVPLWILFPAPATGFRTVFLHSQHGVSLKYWLKVEFWSPAGLALHMDLLFSQLHDLGQGILFTSLSFSFLKCKWV